MSVEPITTAMPWHCITATWTASRAEIPAIVVTSSRARSTRSKSTAWLHEGWGAREIAEAIVEIDLTAADALGELHDELEREGIVFALARVKQDLRAQLERIGLITHIGPERLYATLPVALAAFAARNEHRHDETGPAG